MKVAFGYKMGVGKDTCCNIMKKLYGGEIVSFAGPLYDILYYTQNICGFKKEKDRKFLQFVGTEWVRNIDEEVWIKILIDKTKNFGNFFISDLRFKNELNYLKKNGWICIKIKRNSSEDRKNGGCLEHIIENQLDKIKDSEWDFIIDNNDSEEKLIMKIQNIFGKTEYTNEKFHDIC